MARLRTEAERANRSKDEFLAVLGHELRNPLAPILTALHLMRLRGVDKAEKERTVIERQAHHLVRLVDDLLDVSRITRGKVALKKQRIELGRIVAKAIEMASPLLEQRQHELIVEVEARGLLVDADPERMAQVISNLLANAAKYTEKGGRITVAAAVTPAGVTISVSDTGIGIAPEMIPRVFDMFVQERQALDRSQGGLGLGLTIVRSLVALHGGTVEARSEGRNKGAEFTIHLPPTVEREEPAAGPGEAAAVAPDGRVRRILVVDDNEDAADMLAGFLEEMGHTTRIARDGPEALKMVAEFAPDLALLDIGLPVMDGYELARRLREGAQRIGLVAVTGYGQKNDRQRSQAAGFDAHLVKPVSVERLASLIQELTEGQESP
jgi:CheY-like chemotaxis protein